MRILSFGATPLPVRMQDVRVRDDYPAAYRAGPGGAYVDAYGAQAPATGGEAEVTGLYGDEAQDQDAVSLLGTGWQAAYGPDGAWGFQRSNKIWIQNPGFVREGLYALSGLDAQTFPKFISAGDLRGIIPPASILRVSCWIRGKTIPVLGARIFRTDRASNRLALTDLPQNDTLRWTRIYADVALTSDENMAVPYYRIRSSNAYNVGLCLPAAQVMQIARHTLPGPLDMALWGEDQSASADGAWKRSAQAWTYAGGTAGVWSLASPRWNAIAPIRIFGASQYVFGAYIAGDVRGLRMTGEWRDAAGASQGVVTGRTETSASDLAGSVLHCLSAQAPATAQYLEIDFDRAADGANSALSISEAFCYEWLAQPPLLEARTQRRYLQARLGQHDWLRVETDDGRVLRRRAQLHALPQDQDMGQAGTGLYPAQATFSLGGVGWERTGAVTVTGTADGAATLVPNDGPVSPRCTLTLALTSADDQGDTAGVDIAYGDVHLTFAGLAIDAGLTLEIDGQASTVYQTLAGVRSAAYVHMQFGANHRSPRLLEAAAGAQAITVTGTRCTGTWQLVLYEIEEAP